MTAAGYRAVVRALLVVNPVATGATPGRRDVAVQVLSTTCKLEVVETTARGDAERLAREAADDGLDAVLALGGDGTLNEVVTGVLHRGPGPGLPAVGVLPAGSANVVARTLGAPRDVAAAAHRLAGLLAAGRRRGVDLGRATGLEGGPRWVVFSAGVGVDADVVAAVEAARAEGRPATWQRYVALALREYLAGGRPGRHATASLRLRVHGSGRRAAPGVPPPDGRVHEVAQVLVTNSDPWTYTGSTAVRPTPRASLGGGLDVLAARTLAPGVVARTVVEMLLPGGRGPRSPQVVRGHDLDLVEVTAACEVRAQVDGDSAGRTRALAVERVRRAVDLVA